MADGAVIPVGPAAFRDETNIRFQRVGTIPFNPSTQAQSLRLPPVGFLGYLHLYLYGTISYSSAGTLADLGPWNIINRLVLNTNLNFNQAINVDGFHAYLASYQYMYGFRPDRAGVGDTTPRANNYAFPLSGSTQPVRLHWMIPMWLNDGQNFESGCLLLQSEQTYVTVDIQWGALADIASNISAHNLNLDVYYEFASVTDPRMSAHPPLMITKWVQDTFQVSNTGDNIITLPRQGILLSMYHTVQLNGARSDAIDKFLWRYSKADYSHEIPGAMMSLRNRAKQGVEFPTGVFLWQFFQSMGLPSMGDLRDAIDTDPVPSIDSILTINSGATLGSNNNRIYSLRRILQLAE